MPRTKSKLHVARKFLIQFFAAVIAVTGLWFAGVEFSRTVLARPLGGDESGSNGKHFSVLKSLKLPKGFTPQPGKTYIRGKSGIPHLVELHNGDAAIDWH